LPLLVPTEQQFQIYIPIEYQLAEMSWNIDHWLLAISLSVIWFIPVQNPDFPVLL